MKGYMKKVKAKRMLAMLLSAVMVLSICLPQNVSAASADDRYQGTSDIRSLLTDFQYVIEENAYLGQSGHTVGSVAIGGTFKADNTVGDGAQRPSYANHIEKGTVGDGRGFLGSTQVFYYGSKSDSASLTDHFIANKEYMNVKGMFPSILSQSQALAQDASSVKVGCDADNSTVITLDFSKSKSYTIDYDDFYKAEKINIVMNNINDLQTTEHVINIVDVEDENIYLNGENDNGTANSNNVDVCFNGTQSQFLGGLTGQINGIQCNLSGMKLIWNMPDATGEIKWTGMGGHLVAPQAHANAAVSRFEGGIIAKSLEATAQAHYFPYGDFSVNEEGEVVAKDIQVKKLYLGQGGVAMTPNEQAKFSLYYDAACTQPVPKAQNIVVDANTGYVTFDSETIGLECDKEYYVKETYAPYGYEINDTVYECAISAGGQVSYRKVETNNTVYSNIPPVYENYKKTSTSQKGTLYIAAEDLDNNRAKIKGVVVKVVNDTVSYEKEITTVDNDYVVLEQLEPGTYTVTMTTIPSGYVVPDSQERTVEVKVDKTAYQVYELEKIKANVTIKLREDSVDSDKIVGGGYVEIIGPDGYSRREHVTSLGEVVFEQLPAGNYIVNLIEIPDGYNEPAAADKTVSFVLSTQDKEHTFVLTKPVGDVVVKIVEENTTTVVDDSKTSVGGTVTITFPDGTTETKQDANKDGAVIFTGVPAGTSTVQITTAPDGYVLLEDNPSKSVEVTNGSTANASLPVKKVEEKGNLTIQVLDKEDNDAVYTDKVTLKITGPDGSSYKEAIINGSKIELSDIPVGAYTIAVETPDGWKTIETTVDGSVQPNAVNVSATVDADDPNTNVEETTEVVVYLDVISSLKVIVQEKDGDVIPGATVVVKDKDGTVHEITTGPDGSKTIADIADGVCQDVTVSQIPTIDGKEYKIPDDVVEPTVIRGASDNELVIEVEPYGNIIVEVKEQGTNKVIPGASITITPAPNGTTTDYTTDANAKVTVNKVSLGDYTVEITDADDIWVLPADTNETVSVKKDADGTHTFYVTKKTGTLTVSTVWDDNGTETPVKDCTIKIVDEDGKEIVINNPTTDDTGELVVPNLPVGDYKVTIVSAPSNDYILPTVKTKTGEITVTQDGEVEFILTKNVVAQDGALKIAVFLQDGDTKTPFASATVDLYGVGGSKIDSYTDDVTEKDTLTPGNYKTSINVPYGYALAEGQSKDLTKEVIGGATEPTYYEYVLVKLGTITVTVTDSDTKPVEDVEIAVIDKETKEEITSDKTDGTGKVTFENLPSGEYDVIIKKIPAGYEKPENTPEGEVPTQPAIITIDENGNAEFELPLVGKINVLVYEEGTTTLVSGAEISLDATTNNNNDKSNTAYDGKTLFDKLCDDDYKVTIETAPTNYAVVDTVANPSTVDKTIGTSGREHEVIFYVKALGNMKVKVIEDSTGNGVDEVEVNIKDANGNVIKTCETVNGEITENNLPVGTYTVEVDNDTIPQDTKLITGSEGSKKVTVVANKTAEEVFKIVKTTTLIIDVVDEKDPDEMLDGSKVIVEDQYGNKTEVTATNGTVTLPDWPVTTDTKNPTKVTITKVPSTHVLPDKETTTVVVKDQPENKHVVKAPTAPQKEVTVTITVKDEETKELIPNASVEITYPDGTKKIVDTDENGKIEVTGKPGTYKIQVISVPKGYTKPSKEITKVKVTRDYSVVVEIKKPVTPPAGSTSGKGSTSTNSNSEITRKSPKTGDTGYTPIALAMMVVSIVGLAGIVVYRKKTENE